MTDEKRYVNDEEFCTQGCGRSNYIRPNNLNRVMVEILFRIQEFGGQATHDDLGLQRGEYSTAAHLRYWGLIDQPGGPGTFAITDKGYGFMCGRVKVSKIAYQFDGQIVDEGGPLVSAEDVLGEDYQTYDEIVQWVLANSRIADVEVLDANKARRRPRRVHRRAARQSREAHLAR